MNMVSTTNLGDYTIATDITLEVHVCGVCGEIWGLRREYIQARRNDHKNWVCPNGHPWVFSGPSEEQKLRDQLARKERALDGALQQLNETAKERDHERARANGYKGAVIKTKKRLDQGVCPYCHRSGFTQLARHMQSRHPERGDDGTPDSPPLLGPAGAGTVSP